MSVANILTVNGKLTGQTEIQTNAVTLRGQTDNAELTTNAGGTELLLNGVPVGGGGGGPFVPIAGGTMTGALNFNAPSSSVAVNSKFINTVIEKV